MAAFSARRLAELVGPLESQQPAYREITDRIRVMIVDGRLADGSRLPSERDLASALGVSRTTSTRVYTELREAGLTRSRQGSGSVVALPRSASSTSTLMAMPDDPDTIAMTYSAWPGPPGLARAFELAAEKLPGLLATTGYLPDGLPRLRELIADRYTRDGLPTDPDQIIVTNGAMGAISLVARTVGGAGSRTIVEGVTYPHGADAFGLGGGRLTALPVGERPWDGLDDALASRRHHAAYLVPDFHNPTGAVMTDDERGRWARSLARHDVLPVVDESLREVNLDGVTLPPTLAHRNPRTILIGSSSKAYWGGLRVGWIRAPRPAVVPLLQARMMDDLGTSAFDQLVLCELFEDGGQTLAASRSRARAARDHLLGELATQLPDFRTTCPAGGLNLWLTLPERVSTSLVADSTDHQLMLTAGSRFFPGAPAAGERHLRLPYTHPHEVLTEAVRRLALAWECVASGTATAGTKPTMDLIA